MSGGRSGPSPPPSNGESGHYGSSKSMKTDGCVSVNGRDDPNRGEHVFRGLTLDETPVLRGRRRPRPRSQQPRASTQVKTCPSDAPGGEVRPVIKPLEKVNDTFSGTISSLSAKKTSVVQTLNKKKKG